MMERFPMHRTRITRKADRFFEKATAQIIRFRYLVIITIIGVTAFSILQIRTLGIDLQKINSPYNLKL